MSNEVEDWLLGLCGGVTLNVLSGLFPSLSIASPWPAKLFEEEVEAWKSAQCRVKTYKPNAKTSFAPHLFGKHTELLSIRVKCSTFPSTPKFLFHCHQLRFLLTVPAGFTSTVFKVMPTWDIKCRVSCQVAGCWLLGEEQKFSLGCWSICDHWKSRVIFVFWSCDCWSILRKFVAIEMPVVSVVLHYHLWNCNQCQIK